jgi:hypothetical protein
MTQIKCPNCVTMNAVSALECANCGLPFSSLPPSAFVVADEAPPRSYWPNVQEPMMRPFDAAPVYEEPRYAPVSDIGRQTFMWYRIYLGALSLLYVGVAVMGLLIAMMGPTSNSRDSAEMVITGIVYAVIGAIFFIVHLIALTLPPKSWNWIVGIVMIAIGMTSCCLWPATIPLLIYWIKPETRSFFGRT